MMSREGFVMSQGGHMAPRGVLTSRGLYDAMRGSVMS